MSKITKNEFNDQIDYWSRYASLKSQNHRIVALKNSKSNQLLNIPVIIINAVTGTVVLSLINSITYSILTLFFSFNLILMSYLVNTFFTFLFYIFFVSIFKHYLRGLND